MSRTVSSIVYQLNSASKLKVTICRRFSSAEVRLNHCLPELQAHDKNFNHTRAKQMTIGSRKTTFERQKR
jgi:hypothetical protein